MSNGILVRTDTGVDRVGVDNILSFYDMLSVNSRLSEYLDSIKLSELFTKEPDLNVLVECIQLCEAETFLEIGTNYGVTTAILGLVFPELQIYTIDIPKEDIENADNKVLAFQEWEVLPKASIGCRIPEDVKIHQLYGDSNNIDNFPTKVRYDVVFIDGNHSRPSVTSDSINASVLWNYKKHVVIWHDAQLESVRNVVKIGFRKNAWVQGTDCLVYSNQLNVMEYYSEK